MISTPAHGADRVPRLSVRPLTAGAATPALIILLLCGLGLRLAIAYVFFPSSGFSSDISTYASWALTLVNHGPGGFYANAGFVDYPPAYLYVLWPLGLIAQTLSNASGGDVVGTVESLLKLPPILIDMAVGYVLYRLVSGWARPGRHAERLGLAAAALYVFNPVTFYDSALWGQTDAVGALVLLLGVAALIRGNSEGATALAVLAALVKPQYGVVLLPLVGVVLLKRHLFASGSGPRNSPRGPRRLAAWLSREQGPVRLLTSFVVAWAVFFPVALPFAMGPYEYLKVMAGSAGGYSFLSVNAYNLWALIGSGGNPSLAGSGMWSPDTGPFLGPLSAVLIGSVLLVLGFLLGLARVFWRDDRRSIVLAAAFLCLCFFILPTRVHERYLFPVFAFLPILAVGNRRWLVALVALAVGSFMNLHAILTNLNPIYGTPNVQDLALGDTFRTFPFVALSVALQTAGFVVAAWQLRPGAAGARDAIDASAAEPAVDRVRSRLGRGTAAGARPVGPRPGGVGIADGASAAEGGAVATEAGVIYGRASATVISGRAVHLDAGGGADPYRGAGTGADGSGRGGAGTDAGMDAEPPPDAGTDWGSYERPRYWDWLKSRITAVPLRRDRSGELAGESTGRWDRLDLLLLALIVIGSFTLRAWHLGMPYGMYFDEVYHARTATEFLQDWQYGMPHGIYEYTHPHLAKYSMALSIQQFADNKVTGVANLNTGVEDAAVEVRWSPDTAPNERDGDRLYVADGTEVQVYDLTTRDPVTAIPVTADALAVDPNSHMLYVASAQGVISSFDTTQLDALRRDPGATVDAGTQLTTLTKLNGSVQRLEVVEGTVIALTDEGEVRAVDEGTGDATGTVTLPGAAALTGLPDTSQVVADPTAVTNPAAEAKVLGDALKEDAGLIEPLLRGHLRVSLAGYLSTTTTKSVQSHIDDGSLPGITIQSQAALGVADTAGLTVLDASSLARLDELTFGHGTGLTLVSSGLDHPTLYVAAGRSLRTVVVDSIGPLQSAQVPMPGPVTDVLWNQPANLIHAVGTAPDGSPTIYVVEPHANAVYADAKLPFTPIVTVADTQPDRPEDDRMQIIAFSQDGQLATVDIGGNAFAWRLPGVIMGTLTAACLYLLMRLLFRRRSVAVIAAVLVLVDGMFFANSRIAMNDSYATGFIVAAVTLFAPLYLGIWRRRWQVAAGLMGVGLLLGLALASKWVGAYAMGGLALLLLLRSALGRMIALAALIGMAGVLGELGIRPADIQDPHRNWFFLGLMVVLSMALAVAMVRRPVRFTMDELRFAVVGPALLGALLVVAGLAFGSHLPATGTVTGTRLELAGAGLLILGAAAYALAWLAGHFGLGPLAAPRPAAPDEPRAAPAPTGWLRPGWFGGIPWIYALGCIAIVPLIVYVASYIPWALNGTGSSGPVLFPAGTPIIGLWPPGHAGQTFLDLQVSMYKYHNELRATHAASSPWWA